MRVMEERLKLAQQRVLAAKRKKQKQQDALAEARAKFGARGMHAARPPAVARSYPLASDTGSMDLAASLHGGGAGHAGAGRGGAAATAAQQHAAAPQQKRMQRTVARA